MGLVYLISIYAFFVVFLFAVTYYVNLISSKDLYTKEEISNILPYLKECGQKIVDKYPLPGLTVAIVAASGLGAVIPFISANWFFNSAVFFGALFLVLPIVKERIDSMRVSTSEYYADDVANYLAKYAGIILLGFGAGAGAGLMYNWAHKKDLGFIWFVLNLALIVVLEVSVISREVKE